MSNLKDLEKKYEELGKEIEKLKKEQENDISKDPIFLLSVEEYEKYKNKIPHINCWWWLRSPGYFSDLAAFVDNDGSVYDYGDGVDDEDDAVRPALKFTNLIGLNRHIKSIDDKTIIFCGNTWVKISRDNNVYISETPIAFRRFDEESNDYATSEIRNFLLDWYKERKDW